MQRRKTTLNKKRLKRMYVTDRLTQTEIARQLGVNKDVVRRDIIEMGIWQKRNGGGGRLGRKCLSCGEIYSEPTMFLGIMRCPKCFSFERYIPTTPNAKPVVWTPYTIAQDYPMYQDKGCKEAAEVVGHPVTCENCPIQPECLEVVRDRAYALKRSKVTV